MRRCWRLLADLPVAVARPALTCRAGEDNHEQTTLRAVAILIAGLAAAIAGLLAVPAQAQRAPSASEIAAYQGLHAAAARNHAGAIPELVTNGLPVDARDANGRTPLHVAAFLGHADAMRALVMKAGANPNALDNQKYDIVTILAVNDDVPNLKVALALGASAKNTTSPYDGTALIAAAHLGHDGIVRELIAAGAPLDHVNNLKWTALIESIVLVRAVRVTWKPCGRWSRQAQTSISRTGTGRRR